MRIFIETKRGEELDADQIQRHIGSIATDSKVAQTNILIGLTKEPISQNDEQRFRSSASAHGIRFAAVTFSQVVDALRDQCKEFEPDLLAIVDDYDEYLGEAGLLDKRNQWLVVFPCGTSIAENARFNLYYEPPERPCKRNYRFIGLYENKMVAYVGAVEAIVVVDFDDGTMKKTYEAGHVTDDHLERIKTAVDATTYYDLKHERHRYYLVDHFAPTTLKKESPGGMMNLRYLDISSIISSKYDPKKVYSTDELAGLLAGHSFK